VFGGFDAVAGGLKSMLASLSFLRAVPVQIAWLCQQSARFPMNPFTLDFDA